MTVTVKIGTMPNDVRMASRGGSQDSADVASLGLKLGPAEDGAGVKIVEVAPNSIAEQQGLKAGDIILEVAGADVNGPGDVQDALKAAGKSRVLMLVRSGNSQRFLAIPRAKG
jgi:serine protease Do